MYEGPDWDQIIKASPEAAVVDVIAFGCDWTTYYCSYTDQKTWKAHGLPKRLFDLVSSRYKQPGWGLPSFVSLAPDDPDVFFAAWSNGRCDYFLGNYEDCEAEVDRVKKIGTITQVSFSGCPDYVIRYK